jgi:hypothetical protein
MEESATRPIRGSFVAARRPTMTRCVTHCGSLASVLRVSLQRRSQCGSETCGFSRYGALSVFGGSFQAVAATAGNGDRGGHLGWHLFFRLEERNGRLTAKPTEGRGWRA